MARNHDGWDEIFAALPIVETVNRTGHFDISAEQIKAISSHEPRLMAKVDFREHLPRAMAAEKLAILAISNGAYRIGRFNPFIEIEPVSRVAPVSAPFPAHLLTLGPHRLAHESAALDAALVSGVLSRVFGEDVVLTIRGRKRSPDFTFALGGVSFPVSGVQIEVDGGYEGATSVNLVEAKVGPRTNLNVRQLIYPQLAWEQAIGRRKTVRTFVCFYQEPILRFIPVIHDNGMCRADHARETAFILEPMASLDLDAICAEPGAPVPALSAPFPQADSFATVLAMFSTVVREEAIARDELLWDFDMTPRQIAYYADALCWMGLVETRQGVVHLTAAGRDLGKLSHAEKIGRMAGIIFREPIFNHALRHGTGDVPPALFARWNCESEATRQRRLQTVRAWVAYFTGVSKQGVLDI